MGVQAMDPAMMSYLVWVVRLVLPIIFFVIWHSLQPAKEKKEPQPTGHRHSKLTLLGQRKEAVGQEPPAALSHMKLVDESLVSSSGPRGGRRERRERTTENSEDKHERRERRAERKKAKDGGEISREEKLHAESLLNYVAFSRKHWPEAAFLPDSEHEQATPQSGEQPVGAVEPACTNAHAQMVLRGLASDRLGLKCAELAWPLHDRLVEASVEVDEPTFVLMIEACIRAENLPAVSDFLQKMEASGLCPPSQLLDKVMDLYASHKETETTDVGLVQVQSLWNDKIGNGSTAAVWMDEADTSEGEMQQAVWGDGMTQTWTCSAFNFDAYSDED